LGEKASTSDVAKRAQALKERPGPQERSQGYRLGKSAGDPRAEAYLGKTNQEIVNEANKLKIDGRSDWKPEELKRTGARHGKFLAPAKEDLIAKLAATKNPPGGGMTPIAKPLATTVKPVGETYGPPKADFGGRVPPENLGFDPNPPKDYGASVRSDVERRMGGALKRGAVERRK
jgi:hypothetical protein